MPRSITDRNKKNLFYKENKHVKNDGIEFHLQFAKFTTHVTDSNNTIKSSIKTTLDVIAAESYHTTIKFISV